MFRVAKGGPITINSFLTTEDRNTAREHMLKTASKQMREAAKIGLQSLYADPSDVLEKYKDFDIVKEMKARKDAKLLWVRARAIDADTVNHNGDYFSKEELLKEAEIKGEKIPAYKTFEGVPIYTNHKNDDIEQAKGMVVYAEWDEKENCVYCTFFVDEEAYPDIARNIRTGVIHDVSMGCFIAGTQVLTLNGFKNIELVNSEDELLDAEGNLTKIVNKQINYTKTHIHDIQVEGGYGFECTEEHPILAISKEDWDKRSKRITSGNKKPRIYNFVEPKFIEAKDLKPGDLVAVKTGGQVIESDLTNDQAKLLGLFAAEGNYLKYKGEVKEIEFSFSLDEEFTLVQECVDLLKSCFNKEARVYKREPKSTIVVRLYDESIANWFKYHIGQYSYGKSISKELRYAPLNIQKSFVCSWIKGDGCITHKTQKNQGISATTCSLEFAKDVTYILTRLGIYHKIYARFENKTLLFKDAIKIHSNSKGFDGRHMSFDIEVPSTYASKIASECNFDITCGKVQRKNDNGNYIVRKINANDIKSFNGPVYNFETESHTYSIHNIGVHNCSVAYGTCSKCGNKAYTEKDYCSCLKKWKGKKDPDNNKQVFEYNFDLKFIELSCVGDGAFDTCEIQEIYDVDEVLSAAGEVEKKASEILSNIVIAQQGAPVQLRSEYENCLRIAEDTTKTALRLAQSAGTLVGGALMAGEGASQNSTVNAVLGALGIDPRTGLNILDMINLSLNFLEVAVMNMFARKDNVDLAHVGKITKSMADLQSTMQDMIDDGIDVGSGQAPQALNQQQLQQQQAQQPAANVQQANYMPAGNVGKMVEPSMFDNAVGGGVALASSRPHHLVWASRDGRREVYASTNSRKESNFEKFSKSLVNFKEALDDKSATASVTQDVIRIANERNKNIRNNTPHSLRAEGNNQMDHFAKIAQEQRKKLAAAVTIDFKVEDGAGNRVVLSTDGTIAGFRDGKKVSWEPILNENQLVAMESGQGARVAADLLKDLSGFTKTALKTPSMDKTVKEEELESDRKGFGYKSLGEGLKSQHKANDGMTVREEELDGNFYSSRSDDAEAGESALASAGLYGHKVSDTEIKHALSKLVAQAHKGVSEEGLNERLQKCRVEGTATAHEVMASTFKALGRAVVASYSTPDEIIEASAKLVKIAQLPEMVETSAAGTDVREDDAARADFFKKDIEPSSPVSAVLEQLGAEVSATVSSADLAEALKVAVEEGEMTKEGVTRMAELLMAGAMGSPDEAMGAPSKSEELKAALQSAVDGDENLISKEDLKSAVSGMAMSAEESGVTPGEVVDEIDGMDEKMLVAAVNKARTASATKARLKSRARREFWGERVASKTDISTNVVGWLADYATNFNLSTKSIVTAAKKLCADADLAERLVVKAVETKQNSERTAGMTVTQEKSDTIRFVCREEDLGGVKPSDEGFEDAFRQKAMEVLQGHGFQVDPNTFSFTDLNVSAFGDITASVSSRSSKSFAAEAAMSGGMEEEGPMEAPVVMSDAARMAKIERRNNILNRYAQMAAPGGAPGMGGAPMGGEMGADANAFAGPGLSAMTTDPMAAGGADAMGGEDLDAVSEPGEKKPWGSVCPVCGSDDVNISDSNADCQSCNAAYKILQSIELISNGNENSAKPTEEEDMGAGPEAAGAMPPMPPAGAPVGGPMGAPAPGAPAPAGMPAMAETRGLFRLATTVDSDVYLKTAMASFDRTAELRLPVGMVCPKCGNREASKVKDTTFCYDCGNIAKTAVAQNRKNPSKLDVTITWID